uniref:NADH-ubiquinone oxidoreductase chain 6 n=1 Tax=Ophirina amphinema TaxID=2108040 RepID=A0A348AYU2_9EUKA|nr:NADH dehydrogenase subunit 6 [Ophirina amphinema]
MFITVDLYYFFSFVAIISALCVVFSRNPIHSVLFLVLVFANVSGILVLLGVEYLSMVFLMVYVGAIAVLFLFVVMMLNVRIVEWSESLIKYVPIGLAIGFVFFGEIFLVLQEAGSGSSVSTSDLAFFGHTLNSHWLESSITITNIGAIGMVLYTQYATVFIISGLVLLVAMIGAIVLTVYKRRDVRRQDIVSQIAKDFNEAIKAS